MDKKKYPPPIGFRPTPEDKKILAIVKRLLPRPAGMKITDTDALRAALHDFASKLQQDEKK